MDESTALAATTPAASEVAMGRSAGAPLGRGARVARYVVEAVLGAGGMGIVYRARDPELGRAVALKLVRPEAAAGTQGQARLLREAQAMARLAHPNTVAVFDVGATDDQVFIAMELIDGVSLGAWLRERRRPWREVLPVLLQAGRGLEAAHAAGLVHRDFKPDNALLGRDGRVRVLDLGLARPATAAPEPAPTAGSPLADTDLGERAMHDLTRTGAVLGTPLYMAPEQHLGEPVDARTDQFSFCVALFEALYGQHPFAGESRAELVHTVLAGKLAEPGVRVPRWLHRAVVRGLSPAPARRHPSMTVLLAELERGLRRSWRLWFAVAILAFIAIAAILLARREAPPPAEPTPTPTAAPPPELLATAVHRQVTFTGAASVPALSPDGERLAYASRSGERSRLVVQDLATGRARVVTWWNDEIGALQWTGDGARVLVNVASDSGAGYIVPVDGGERIHVPLLGAHVAWSDDGGAYVASFENPEYLLRFDVARGQVSYAKIDLSPSQWADGLAWSPSRDLVVMATREKLGSAVWTLRSDGSEPRKTLVDHASPYMTDLRWSGPDADTFTAQRARDRSDEIVAFRARPNGDVEEVGVLLRAEQHWGHALAADGKRLAYVQKHRDVNLVRVRAGAQQRPDVARLTSGTQFKYRPSPSPDGTSVAFVMGPSSEGHIFVMPIAGGEPRRVTSLAAEVRAIAWSPDARRIAFTQVVAGAPALQIVELETGAVQPISAEDMSGSGSIAWAPGPDILYHAADHQNFVVLDPRSGARRPLVPPASRPQQGWMFDPAYAPDGQQVAVFYNRDIRGLWTVPLASGGPALVSRGDRRPLAWSDDGASILAAEETAIVAIARATGARQPLLDLPTDLRLSQWRHVPRTPASFVAIDDRSTSDIWLTGDFADDAVAAVVPAPTEPVDARLPPGYPAALNPAPQNLDLEAGPAGAAPPGWHLGEESRRATAVTVDLQPHGGSKAVRLARGQPGLDERPRTELVQYVDAAPYRGKRVRLRAALRAGPDARLGVWLRWERPDGRTEQRSTAADANVTAPAWTTRDELLDVPDDADLLAFGASLEGREGWLDSVSLAVVARR